MRFGDLLSIAFLNLWRRKLRAFLTVLGMTIGVASIVVMVSLGIGIREATIQSFAGTGSLTLIQVNSWSYVDMGDGTGTSRETELNKRASRRSGRSRACAPSCRWWRRTACSKAGASSRM